MRILFAWLPEIGHVNPFLGVARWLVGRGHELAVHCARSFEPQLARAGVPARWFRESEVEPPPTSARDMAARMRNERWLERWYDLALSTVPNSVESLARAIRAFRPDVLCIDPLMIAAAIAAERERLPWAAVATNFASLRPPGWGCPFLDAGKKLAPRFRALLDRLGADAIGLEGTEVVSPWFNSVFTTEAFIPRAMTANPHATYVGPPRAGGPRGDETAFPWDRLDDRPLVYVSSGGGQSLSFDPQCLLRIARALDPATANVVMAVPQLHEDVELLAMLPPHCVVTPYAPQVSLLDRAAVAVTHGGVNTVNECLDRGCPMLVLPLGKDQPLQAELVVRAGLGLALDPASFAEPEGRDALLQLLSDGPHREHARHVRDSYRATASTVTIGAALERIGREGR